MRWPAPSPARGPRAFLADRTRAKLDPVSADIRSHGGAADAAIVDALNEQAVDAYVAAVVEQGGYLDISFAVGRARCRR